MQRTVRAVFSPSSSAARSSLFPAITPPAVAHDPPRGSTHYAPTRTTKSFGAPNNVPHFTWPPYTRTGGGDFSPRDLRRALIIRRTRRRHNTTDNVFETTPNAPVTVVRAYDAHPHGEENFENGHARSSDNALERCVLLQAALKVAGRRRTHRQSIIIVALYCNTCMHRAKLVSADPCVQYTRYHCTILYKRQCTQILRKIYAYIHVTQRYCRAAGTTRVHG